MSEANKSIPLTTEQRFVLSQLVEKGSLVKVGSQTFLMSPVRPMMEDFLKAIRLPEVPNNLAGVGETSAFIMAVTLPCHNDALARDVGWNAAIDTLSKYGRRTVHPDTW